MSESNRPLNGDESAGPEVYDEADQASMFQMAETEKALAEIRNRVAPETHPDFDGKTCVECGEKIPKARLNLGKVRCVHCQSALEVKGRMYASNQRREE